MKTIIYSCGDGMTSRELMDSVRDLDLDCIFPETGYYEKGGSEWLPLHEHQQLDLLKFLVGKTVVTVSSIIIRMLLREVRKGRIRTDELELYCGGRRIQVDTKGDMLDHWDGGFFEDGFNLIFD